MSSFSNKIYGKPSAENRKELAAGNAVVTLDVPVPAEMKLEKTPCGDCK
jgi:hypothetical protein